MRAIDINLKSDIEAGTIARLLRIACTNFVVFGFTDHDKELLVDGDRYSPAPGMSSVEYTSTSNVEVSTQQAGAAILDVPESDLLGGVFDDATVEAAWCSWKNPSFGKVITFSGKIASIDWDEGNFRAEIMSFMKQLELNIGHTYTASCRHQLFSTPTPGKLGACNVDPSAFSFSGSVASVQTPKWKFTISGPAAGKADGYYSNGVLIFGDGPNAGLSVSIKKQVGDVLELLLPTAFTVSPGNTFFIKAGCDKTLATCKAKFSNVPNFGGFPHIQTDVTFR